jgi:hypothetical protein
VFAPIRGELARLYIAHALDLGLGGCTDTEIVITAALIGCCQVALQRGDRAWLDRHHWFGEACERLFNSQQVVPLDG